MGRASKRKALRRARTGADTAGAGSTRRKKRWWNQLLKRVAAFAVGVLVTLVAQASLALLAVSEPNLRWAGEAMRVSGQAVTYGDSALYFFRDEEVIRNYSLRSGFIDRCEPAPQGAHYFPDVKVVYLDRSPLSWLQKKRIRCEMRVMIRGPVPDSALHWSLYYYDNLGREVLGVNVTYTRQR